MRKHGKVIALALLTLLTIKGYGQNFGIGELNPSAKLHVKSTGIGTGFAVKITDGVNTNLLTVRNNGELSIFSGTAASTALDALVIDASGVVGKRNLSAYLTQTSLANGDVTGQFANLTVGALQGTPLSITAGSITTGYVLKWNGSAWVPQADNAGPTTANGDVTGAFTALNVIALQGTPLGISGTITTGYVLKWNGTAWVPQADNTGQTYTAGNAILITPANVISVSAENGITVYPTTLRLGGDLTQNTTIAQAAFSMNFDLNGAGGFNLLKNGSTFLHATNAGYVGLGIAAPNAKLHLQADANDANFLFRATTSTPNDIFTIRNNGEVAIQNLPASLANNLIAIDPATGILGSRSVANFITDASAAGGDVTGTFPNLSVVGLQGSPLNITASGITAGFVLKWDGAAWTPQLDEGGILYTAGGAIDLSANAISVLADNGLTVDLAANSVQLGGTLLHPTTITQSDNDMIFNLTGIGNFNVRSNGSPNFHVNMRGNVGIGTEQPNLNALLELKSTTRGMLPVRMTSAQRTSYGGGLTATEEGMLVYDLDSTKFFYWSGTAWIGFPGAGGSSGQNLSIHDVKILDWDWGNTNDTNGNGREFTLSGVNTVLGIPDTAVVFVTFNPPITNEFVVTCAWMTADVVHFNIRTLAGPGVFGASSPPTAAPDLTGTKYVFIW